MKTNTKENDASVNILWRLRQASGLELKQAAKLLGQNSTDHLSRYEQGITLPTLKNAVKLMLIYNAAPDEIFPDLFDSCRKEIQAKLKNYSMVISLPKREKLLESINSCTYEEMLTDPTLSESEKAVIRKHVTKLASKLAYL